jgi:cell wall-associated NlpC family hydrolase
MYLRSTDNTECQIAAAFVGYSGCRYPKALLASRPCDVPVNAVRPAGDVIQVLHRQTAVIIAACVAAGVIAGTATGDPSIGAKQARARQVLAEINQLDASLERARNAYDSATAKLRIIEHDLMINQIGLHVARVNLVKSQNALEQRLVSIYTSRDDQSTLAVLLGATSIDDLVNRIETVQSVSAQDVAVVKQVVSFKHQITARQRFLVRAHRAQTKLVRQRAAAKARISSQLARQHRLYASIKNQIAHLIAMQRARQLQLARQAQARLAAYRRSQDDPSNFGVSASSPDGYVAPPSQYTGVVSIAMRYLGVPYVWGGESPSGFDCSGFVAYVYAQVGVSLPHYTGAQWAVGVPVDQSDLEPGDLVFFDGLGHVGIYIGGGQFIHAPHTGDVVKISSLSEAWYAATYDGARRIT